MKHTEKRAVISLTKDKSFATGIHLHAGCMEAEFEICLTFSNQGDYFPYRKLTTTFQPLKITSNKTWTYFGFTYTKSAKGKCAMKHVFLYLTYIY